jgi:aconitate hydratase
MGILPLQFIPGQNAESLHLSGEEVFKVGEQGELKAMLDGKFPQGKEISVFAESDLGKTIEFSATVRIDTPQEILYYQHGGILQYVLRQLAGDKRGTV